MGSRQEGASPACLRDVSDSLSLQALVDFFAMHGHVLRCRETKAHLVASYAEYSDGHIVADHY
jgi:hypothetical protein